MSSDPNNPIVCTCTEMTRGDFLNAMSANRTLEFGDFLEKTGAGMKCTACRLDLELLYTDNFDQQIGNTKNGAATTSRERKLPFKQRLYRLLDKFAPMVPIRLSNTVPVLRHNGVRQYVVICNDPPLYKSASPDPVSVRLILRDANGRICADQHYEVTEGRPLDVEVSSMLPESADERPTIGSIQVMRWWKRPTKRGTTRPQILIEAPGGCGAVHTTGPNGPGDTWYTCIARPADDRYLLGIVNTSGASLKVAISYPYAAGASVEYEGVVSIPPHGSALHEVVLPEQAMSSVIGKPFDVRCKADGFHKCYLITANPTLDRFAIDHPAGT
jgi:BFD-like [2Fe-2S] binding domain